MLKSNRGLPLVVQGSPPEGDVLTVEFYQKWYSLWRINRDMTVHEISFRELEEFIVGHEQSPYVDHVPNPVCVRRYAEHHNLYLPTLAEELIEGRWVLDVVDNRVGPGTRYVR